MEFDEIHWLCLVAAKNVESKNLNMFDNKQDNQNLWHFEIKSLSSFFG